MRIDGLGSSVVIERASFVHVTLMRSNGPTILEFGHLISALAARNVSVSYREGAVQVLRNFRFSADERRSGMER